MSIKNKFKIHIFKFIFICTITTGISEGFASEVTETEVLSIIKNREKAVESGVCKTAAFKILTQASMFDPNQGFRLEDCILVFDENDVSMKINYDYLQDPVYILSDSENRVYQSIDYDRSGRLIVWRKLQTYVRQKSMITEVLEKNQLLYVSPNGDIEVGGVHTTKNIYSMNRRNDRAELKYFLLAAGLSFSEYINADNVSVVKSKNKNRIEINTKGKFLDDIEGIWKIMVDPNSNFFVKEASFEVEGSGKALAEISTSDIVKNDGLEYAKQGRLILNGSYIREYMDINISVQKNQELREEVDQQFIASLPTGSDIIDFTGGEPIRTTVK